MGSWLSQLFGRGPILEIDVHEAHCCSEENVSGSSSSDTIPPTDCEEKIAEH